MHRFARLTIQTIVLANLMVSAANFLPPRTIASLSGGTCGVPTHQPLGGSQRMAFKDPRFLPYKPRFQTRLDLAARWEELRVNITIIRVSVIYDDSMLAEYKTLDRIVKYVRNFIYQTQLIYERPEMVTKVRLFFMVTSIAPAKVVYNRKLRAFELLKEFNIGPDFTSGPGADLKILMIGREFAPEPNSPFAGRTVGIAYLGTICSRAKLEALVIVATTTGSFRVLAHEIAHSFNVGHDGEEISSNCKDMDGIMVNTDRPESIKWSSCAVDQIRKFLSLDEITNCLKDPNRLKDARPYSRLFNFKPEPGNVDRHPLPGVDMRVDEQCQYSIDPRAVSSERLEVYNGAFNEIGYENCQESVCKLAGYAYYNIGPVYTGSWCLARSLGVVNNTFRQGTCYHQRCIPDDPIG